jgi:alpha-tubulin suppressor-like RCC1 family protein
MPISAIGGGSPMSLKMSIRTACGALLVLGFAMSGCAPCPTPINGPTQIVSGDSHSCAQMADGTVKCWGWSTSTNSDVAVTEAGVTGVYQLAASVIHTCGLFSSGSAECWAPLANPFPAPASGARLTTGNAHTCWTEAGGAVRCAGDNHFGQLGDGTYNSTPSPPGAAVVGITGAKALAAGQEFTCALLGTGTVRCWGEGSFGQLGNGSNAGSNVPVDVAGLTGVVAISAYQFSACALLQNGSMYCWGHNASGQLGDGTTTSHNSPVQVVGLSGATAITAGADHSCAVVGGGAIKCWGDNTNGQLGNGTNTASLVPVVVSQLSGATAVSAGGPHTCALVAGGSVKCWGSNSRGELGNGTYSSSNVPVQVIGVP